MKHKLPPQAKRVFKGVIFDVYQWPQKMFDGTTATFEAIKRPDTVQIIAVQGDKIVMSREEQPDRGLFYSLFGGRAEENEDPLAAAKRELAEESGLTSHDWELYQLYEAPGRILWNVYIYIARDCQQTGKQQLDAGEKITPKRVSFNAFLKMVGDPSFRGRQMMLDLILDAQTAAGKKKMQRRLFGK